MSDQLPYEEQLKLQLQLEGQIEKVKLVEKADRKCIKKLGKTQKM